MFGLLRYQFAKCSSLPHPQGASNDGGGHRQLELPHVWLLTVIEWHTSVLKGPNVGNTMGAKGVPRKG